jgi:hypothetical protein
MRDDQQLKSDLETSSLKWEAEHGCYITIADYFGTKPHTAEHTENAIELLRCVNAMFAEYVTQGGILHKDPDTGTYISGSKGGAGDGGFRLPDSATGRQGSAHKEAKAVDPYDPDNRIDEWITRDILIKFGLWREARQHSPGWVHLQTREPKSHMRSFNP